MAPVLEAELPKMKSTVSNYYNEWLSFLDEEASFVQARPVTFPDLAMSIVEYPDGYCILTTGNTSVSERYYNHLESDIIDDVESPLMPAKRQFAITLTIENIEKGRPSLCDEVEL